MTVQIQPAKPSDQRNGLAAHEDEIVGAEYGEEYVVVARYKRVKRVEDEEKGITYPVLRQTANEVLEGEAAEAALDLMRKAYSERTGEAELPDPDGDVFGDDDAEDGAL